MALAAKVQGKPSVLGDRHLLSAAIANLVENAIKYADGSPDILVSVEQAPKHISIVVEDRGPGVPAESLTRVTERFYRLESRVPGSGLGLSIVTAIAHLHQGELRLEDARESGAQRRIIVLPRRCCRQCHRQRVRWPESGARYTARCNRGFRKYSVNFGCHRPL